MTPMMMAIRLDGAADKVTVDAREACDRAEQTGARRVSLPRVCLLVLEDDAPVADVIARLAKEEGLEPVIAHTLAGAARLLAAKDVRRAVVDRFLPDGTADLLLATLKARNIDCVCFSGKDPPQINGVPVIEKPNIPRLREWMRRRQP